MGEAKRRRQHGKPSSLSVRQKRRQWIMRGALIVVIALVIGTVLWVTDPERVPEDRLPVAGDADPFPREADQYGIRIGDPDAPVVVREFADYQCPACAQFSEVHERLKEEYIEPGHVRFVFFDLPLRQHANAIPAAEAARCANDQRQWEEMHRLLFDRQSRWSNTDDPAITFTDYAVELGMDERRFRRCMSTQFHREAVEDSRELAQRLRVTSTPTVFVDNIRLTRNNWTQLRGVIERELQDQGAGR